jgi:hypothetical protein
MFRFVQFVVASLACLVAICSPALAQNNMRSFMSITGSDANPCTNTEPCRTLQRAHDTTLSGGTVTPITAGGYGPVIISKAIKILNNGVGTLGITAASGGNGVTINAAAGNDVVLEGLTIDSQTSDGVGAGSNGILVNSANNVAILNCSITGLAPNSGNGIAITESSPSQVSFIISNSYIAGNFNGVLISGTASVFGVVQTTTLQGNNGGFAAFGGGSGTVTLDNVTLQGNDQAIHQSSNIFISLTRSNFEGNGTAAMITDGAVASFGDNRFDNGSDGNNFSAAALR